MLPQIQLLAGDEVIVTFLDYFQAMWKSKLPNRKGWDLQVETKFSIFHTLVAVWENRVKVTFIAFLIEPA